MSSILTAYGICFKVSPPGLCTQEPSFIMSSAPLPHVGAPAVARQLPVQSHPGSPRIHLCAVVYSHYGLCRTTAVMWSRCQNSLGCHLFGVSFYAVHKSNITCDQHYKNCSVIVRCTSQYQSKNIVALNAFTNTPVALKLLFILLLFLHSFVFSFNEYLFILLIFWINFYIYIFELILV